MTTQIEASYATRCYATNPELTAAAMQAAPLDWLPLLTYGLLPHSDETVVSGSTVTRTIKLYMVPTSTATATSTLVGNGSAIESVTVTGAGNAYPKQPVVTFDGNPIYTAYAVANMQVNEGTVLQEGSDYVSPVVSLSAGGLAPGGTPAVISLTVGGGGLITGVTVVTPGGPYITPPVVTITDSDGSGAEVVLGLSIASISVSAPVGDSAYTTAGIGSGFSYGSAPDVIITPYFKAMIANGSPTEQGIISNWMTGILEKAVTSPVRETVTVS